MSALEPAGRDAERLSVLFTWMWFGALVIWLGMIGLALWVPRSEAAASARGRRALIIGGGVVFPLVVLTLLLVFGVAELPATLARGHDRVTLEITGRQWWWRVRYLEPGFEPLELANEIRLPVGRRIDAHLLSDNVVHSFWVPALTGKMDMVPGRINRIALEPTRTGTFQGACAEFCGLSHAHMHLDVVTLEPAAFEQWLAAQRAGAQAPDDAEAQRGAEAFLDRGCGVCHTVRGTDAAGRAGPDLTHVGSRLSLAAGLLPNDANAFSQWITGTERLKPGAHMPAFAALPAAEVSALSTYLSRLR